MFRIFQYAALAAIAVTVGLAGTQAVRADEIVLRAQTALPKHHDLAKSFLEVFVPKVNAAGKGIIQIKYIGGPEVTPANKAAAALKRGVFDMLHSPAAYHVGIVPEGSAMMVTTRLRWNSGPTAASPCWRRTGKRS